MALGKNKLKYLSKLLNCSFFIADNNLVIIIFSFQETCQDSLNSKRSTEHSLGNARNPFPTREIRPQRHISMQIKAIEYIVESGCQARISYLYIPHPHHRTLTVVRILPPPPRNSGDSPKP